MPDQDVYRMCPCGSGKKLKFCCLSVLEELGRASEFEQREQFDKAAAYLEGVLKKGVSERTARTGLRLMLAVNMLRTAGPGKADQAGEQLRGVIHEMLKDTPDHPEVLALDALQELRDKGYPAAQKKYSRALQKLNGQISPWGSTALYALGEYLLEHSHPLAAIKNFLQSALQTTPESREQVMSDISRLTRDGGLLYPLRLNHLLRPLNDLGPLQSHWEQATKFVRIGCFSEAAKALAPIARERRDDWAVWWDMGLCHAWAAEDPLAVRALTAAASAVGGTEPEVAADCLMLARILDEATGDDAVEVVSQRYDVKSMGRLLTALDASPRLKRIDESHDHDHDSPAAQEPHDPSSVTYAVLDKADSTSSSPLEWPKILGQFIVVAANPEENEPARAQLILMDRKLLADVQKLLQEAGTDELTPSGEVETEARLFPEHAWCDSNWMPPAETPISELRLSRALLAAKIDHWLELPQSLLKGQTPLQAAGNPELRPHLIAAVRLLEAYLHRRNHLVDVESVRERLGLGRVPLVEIDETSLGSQNLLGYGRLDLAKLSTKSLLALAMNVFGTGMPTIRSTFHELLQRSDVNSDPRMTESLGVALFGHLQQFGCPEEASELIQKLVDWSRKAKSPFQTLAMWEIRLLGLTQFLERKEEAQEIAQRIWSYYVPKLPELRAELVRVLRGLVEEGPWHALDAEIPTAGTTSAGGIWTPDSAPAEAPGKLWIPGS